MANTLEIVIKARDQASGAIHSVNASLGSMGATIGHIAATSIGFLGARVLEGLASKVRDVGTALLELPIQAAPLQGIQAGFEGISGAADDTLARLREASAGMISNRELMLKYNLAAQLVSEDFAEQLPDAMKYLTKIAASTGQSMDYMMESLVRGVGRLSPLILDNLAIQVSLEEATARAAEMFGKETDALSKAEIQVGMTNIVMEKLAANTANIPDVVGTASQGLAGLSSWFQNLRDRIGTAFLPALQNILDLLNRLAPVIEDTVMPAIEALGQLADKITEDWAHSIADLIGRAATWGANIVESLAGGIEGSDAVVRALQHVADNIAYWLMPGSPPKILPDLSDWGQGAIEAWLKGWHVSQVKASGFLRDLQANLKPFLQDIDLGKAVDPARVREVFGGNAADVEHYLAAYRDVGIAVERVATAREALLDAEEGGDEAVIAGAQKEHDAAQKEEYAARRRFYSQERQLERRVSAEVQLARAISERSKIETKAAEKAAKLSSDAEQRAIEQAYLQYRLAVAGTAEAQIPIWQEELGKVAEGTAEAWRIKTRIVELERVVANAGKGAGTSLASGIDQGLAAGLEAGGEQRFKDIEVYMGGAATKIDWGGIGKAIAEAVWRGFTEWVSTQVATIVQGWVDDLTSEESLQKVRGIGAEWGTEMVRDLASSFGKPTNEADRLGVALPGHVMQAESPLVEAAKALGHAFAEGFIAAFKKEWAEAGGFLGILGLDDFVAKLKREAADAVEDAADLVFGKSKGAGSTQGYEHEGTVSGFALGTNFFPGGWGLVGEWGPELLRLPRGSQILPANETERAMGPTNNVSIVINAPGGEPRAVRMGVLDGLRAAGVVP